MTPALSYCTAKAFRRSVLPLVELAPGRALKAANDPFPIVGLRSVAGADPRHPFFEVASAGGGKLPSYGR